MESSFSLFLFFRFADAYTVARISESLLNIFECSVGPHTRESQRLLGKTCDPSWDGHDFSNRSHVNALGIERWQTEKEPNDPLSKLLSHSSASPQSASPPQRQI